MQQYNYPMMYQQQPYTQNYPYSAYYPQTSPQIQQTNNLPPTQNQVALSPKFDVVQGTLAADMYQVENGQEIILMDMDNPYVYRKKRNIDGKLEPMKRFKLVEEEENPVVDYVKQEEVENIVEKLVKREVEKKLSEITLKPTRKKGDE